MSPYGPDAQQRIQELERTIRYTASELRHISYVMGNAKAPAPDYVIDVYVETIDSAAHRLESAIREDQQ